MSTNRPTSSPSAQIGSSIFDDRFVSARVSAAEARRDREPRVAEARQRVEERRPFELAVVEVEEIEQLAARDADQPARRLASGGELGDARDAFEVRA